MAEKPCAPPVLPSVKAPVHLPHPAKNLATHLKPSKSGEIVTNHHRGAKKR